MSDTPFTMQQLEWRLSAFDGIDSDLAIKFCRVAYAIGQRDYGRENAQIATALRHSITDSIDVDPA